VPVLPPPPGLLSNLGHTAQASIVADVRQALDRHYPDDHARARNRAAAHLETGLTLLIQWMEQDAFDGIDLEQCRALSATRPGLSFVYNLPNSVGFGAAIGGTLEEALFGNELADTRELTALLQAFMTMLDGLLDESPELMANSWTPLLETIEDPDGAVDRHDAHPFVSLCFSIARKWSRAVRTSPRARFRSTFLSAAREAMSAEYVASATTLRTGSPPTFEGLYGRTRWPHWTQGIACLLYRDPPADFDIATYRNLIFQIADYVAFLDDVRDYVDDYDAGRWNTVMADLYHEKPFASGQEWRLLVHLGDERFARRAVETALSLRGAIGNAVARAGLPSERILTLVGDMSHVSLL
jgi:hypothetical protein